jgi:hypothetical protein
MRAYERPEITLVGSLVDVTLATHMGNHCDKHTCTLGKGQTLSGTGQAS